jgi:acetolactate synthase-1/2/3 large subunit
MLSERCRTPLAPAFAPVETAPAAEDMATLEALIAGAERPVMVLGGPRWTEAACAAARRFAERFDMPVATSYRRGPLFDALHRCYAGDLGLGPNPKLVARVKASDLVIFVGGRINEITAQGYTLFDIPEPRTRLVHIHPGAEELGRIYSPHLAINASPIRFAAALEALTPPAAPARSDQTLAAHEEYLAWSDRATPQPGEVNLGEVMVWLRENLPDDAILCNGAGNYASWIHRFYRFRRFASHIAPTSASMGYGVPAAVAMKRLHPGRPVISINGDGDFLMNGQEFAIAVQYRLPILVVIADNGIYGTIRMHQEREHPGRVEATDLVNPDFAAYARAFGGFGVTVEKTADFPAAFRAAEASGLPAIVHLKIDPEAITPGATLTQIRAQALEKAAAKG